MLQSSNPRRRRYDTSSDSSGNSSGSDSSYDDYSDRLNYDLETITENSRETPLTIVKRTKGKEQPLNTSISINSQNGARTTIDEVTSKSSTATSGTYHTAREVKDTSALSQTVAPPRSSQLKADRDDPNSLTVHASPRSSRHSVRSSKSQSRSDMESDDQSVLKRRSSKRSSTKSKSKSHIEPENVSVPKRRSTKRSSAKSKSKSHIEPENVSGLGLSVSSSAASSRQSVQSGRRSKSPREDVSSSVSPSAKSSDSSIDSMYIRAKKPTTVEKSAAPALGSSPCHCQHSRQLTVYSSQAPGSDPNKFHNFGPCAHCGTTQITETITEPPAVNLVVKYVLFSFCLILWLISVGIILVGIQFQLATKELQSQFHSPEGTADLHSILFNLSIAIIVAGLIMFVITFTGCIGALRENTTLLSLFILLQVVLIFLIMLACVLLLVYNRTIYKGTISVMRTKAIPYYTENSDWQKFLDYVQLSLQCCGVENYTDWRYNAYYNCSNRDMIASACGVPYSCCTKSDNIITGVRNTHCGYGVQQLSSVEAAKVVNSDGCVSLLEQALNMNITYIICLVIFIILTQLMVIIFAFSLIDSIRFIKDSYVLEK